MARHVSLMSGPCFSLSLSRAAEPADRPIHDRAFPGWHAEALHEHQEGAVGFLPADFAGGEERVVKDRSERIPPSGWHDAPEEARHGREVRLEFLGYLDSAFAEFPQLHAKRLKQARPAAIRT